jgi:hypothetical protein
MFFSQLLCLHLQTRTSRTLTHVNIKGKQLQIMIYNSKQIPTQLLESINSTPTMLRDDGNDKLSLITESVAATRIDMHPAGEEPDQHAIRLTPGGSHV